MGKFLENKGFTLAEVLVSIFIIVLLSGIIFVNYRQAGRQFALQRSANKLAQDIRKVQEMAMSAKKFQGSIPSSGYGVYLNILDNPPQYILFADTSNPGIYDVGEMVGNPIEFERRIEIDSLKIDSLSASPLTITFTPPNPKVWVNGIEGSAATITLKADTRIKTITVNAVGLISIQ
jgi:prepilin-type N-terminal cleavage/methylation domain-containing protein